MRPQRHAARRQPLHVSDASDNGSANGNGNGAASSNGTGSDAGKNLSSSRSNGGHFSRGDKPMDSRTLKWAQASFKVPACYHMQRSPLPPFLPQNIRRAGQYNKPACSGDHYVQGWSPVLPCWAYVTGVATRVLS